ncbi:NADP-dependent oxidoreductase domain-containing protein [Blyttiomyces helicus]|uniref:NADP-dependent oxidoreductase domain-containing protein n=1 Tax=Blyttiomyces helicus TaxID=388810 RepID=A0A4P9WAR2_9FUNG|nr:NADP-dependent oxidoreductase domain-containing protein [Blyttiomyces helicus]|eukprot:RKO89691.1 NADP-dependent oxidoreductase domain-containing protein [Blyttiomyces helicus]
MSALFARRRARLGPFATSRTRGLHTGGATPLHTRQFAESITGAVPRDARAAVPGFTVMKKPDLVVSRLGFGAYRTRNDVGEHAKALKLAIQSGVNVIDTSGHFENGSSEEMIGAVLNDVLSGGTVRREALVLITKAGYMSGRSFEGASAFERAIMSDNVAHSLASAFLEREIGASLDRLGVEKVDVLMLNNPERMVAGRDKRHTPDHIDLLRILNFSSEAFKKNFSSVEYPLNLFEAEALDQDFDGSPALVDVAQFTHRALNSIANGQIRPLLTRFDVRIEDEPRVAETLTKSFESVAELESNLVDQLGDDSAATAILAKFVWAQVLGDNLSRLTDNPFTVRYYLEKQVLPAIDADLTALETIGDSTLPAGWAEEYRKQTRLLSKSIIQLSFLSLLRANLNLASVLASVAPEAIGRDDQLAVTAARMSAAAVGSDGGSVLVGMRKSEYVTELVDGVMRRPGLTEEQVDAVRDAAKHA